MPTLYIIEGPDPELPAPGHGEEASPTIVVLETTRKDEATKRYVDLITTSPHGAAYRMRAEERQRNGPTKTELHAQAATVRAALRAMFDAVDSGQGDAAVAEATEVWKMQVDALGVLVTAWIKANPEGVAPKPRAKP